MASRSPLTAQPSDRHPASQPVFRFSHGRAHYSVPKLVLDPRVTDDPRNTHHIYLYREHLVLRRHIQRKSAGKPKETVAHGYEF